MEFLTIEDDSAAVEVSRFRGHTGVEEIHLIIRPTRPADFKTQLDDVARAYGQALSSLGIGPGTVILRRFFCADVQAGLDQLRVLPLADPESAEDPCAISCVGQPPPAPALVSMWAYHIQDPRGALAKRRSGPLLVLARESLSHCLATGLTAATGASAFDQTRAVFSRYASLLAGNGMSLADHAVRTWIFVRDIDANYADMVAARREFFAAHGLTAQTHSIASTGIEAVPSVPAAAVAMDAYAIASLRREQVEYLTAPEHLGPAHRYGVTFERATAISYRDRKHILVSGTASIDREGRIAYAGNLRAQLDRALANVAALLARGGAALGDMSALLAYVRNADAQPEVSRMLRDRFGDMPIEVVAARICRPGWLVEVEGTAIIPADNPALPPF